jgi:hypothetical protein
MLGLSSFSGARFCRKWLSVGSACLISAALLPVVNAQGSDDNNQPTPTKSQSKPTFSSTVKVVNLLATVRDKHGQIINNLSKDDLSLEEDGRPQIIKYFTRETDLPLKLGLLVDTSMSTLKALPDERNASGTFLDEVVREDNDSAFVIRSRGGAASGPHFVKAEAHCGNGSDRTYATDRRRKHRRIARRRVPRRGQRRSSSFWRWRHAALRCRFSCLR